MNALLFRERLEALQSQSQVARMLGCTRQNIDLIERKALAKILRHLHRLRAEQCFDAGILPDEWWRRMTRSKSKDE